MDVLWCSLLVIFSIFFLQICFQKHKKKLPPSPPALPIFGHLHLLKRPTHRTLQHLSAKYGPIFYLRLGNRPTIVVSSPFLAEECFTKNDIIFANRPPCILADHCSYDNTEVTFLPYGDQWRNRRRIMNINIFSYTAVNHYSAIREEEIRFVVRRLLSNSNESRKVNLSSLFSDFVFDVIMKTTTGRRWPDSERLTKDVFGADIPLHLCDFVPFLRWIGFGGFEKQVKYVWGEINLYLQYLIEEARKNDAGSGPGKQKKSIIQSLLSLQESEPAYYTDDLIKGIIANLFSAGPETTAATVQWTMSLLLNHPKVMEKIASLGGFNIPRGTTLVVNAWAIHRDPNAWEEPSKFKPERFEGMKRESEGFKFLPFGMGRRPCPGAAMAMRAVGLTIGTMIQCFEWERIGPELAGLEEGSGLFVLPKAEPLEAFCRPRPSVQRLLSQV